ncbi:hypothetical protein ACTJKN_02145 [Pedobacter sp. 22163]|uniref:hypothetical protein n=1 Tax=Pedobacter sp. 22163 TaxID=3453883 RepID=UPI003F8699B2
MGPLSEEAGTFEVKQEESTLEITAYVIAFYNDEGNLTGFHKFYEFRGDLEGLIQLAVRKYKDKVSA